MSDLDLVLTDHESATVRVQVHAGVVMEQSYRPVGGGSLTRLSDGTGVIQVHWGKLSTRITGQGRVPPGMAGLTFDGPLTIDCVEPRAVVGETTTLILPGTLRPGAAVIGWALDGRKRVRTPVSMLGNEATLTPVDGAAWYEVQYLPRLVVFSQGPDESFHTQRGYRWQLDGEEL
jgi:hypothetical protein